MAADQFRGDLLGAEQRGDRLTSLAALGVGAVAGTYLLLFALLHYMA